jgi:peptide/nickel transport system substrate-binding protein
MPGRDELFALATAAAASLMLAACRPGDEPRAGSEPEPSTLRVGIGQVATSPGLGLRSVVENLTLEQLATLSADGRPRPALAKDWTVSSDGLELTVNLRPGVTFHDGTALSGAVVANALQSTLRATMGPALEDVDDVTAPNDQQVVVRFRRPSPFMLDSLEVFIQKRGPPAVGTGPFVPADPKSLTDLRANSQYHMGAPAIDRVVVTTYPSVRSAWAELLRGQLDMLMDVGADALESLETSSQVSVFTYTRHYQYLVAFNTQAPVFKSSNVRRALSMAIDKNALVREALNGRGVPSSGPVWPQNYAFRADFAALPFDVEAAAAALAPHRATGGAKRLRFTCLVPPDAVNERIALVLKQQLAAAGADMVLEETSMDQIVDALKNRRFEAALVEGVSGPTLLRPYQLWHSKGAVNPGGLGSPKIDTALDRIRHAGSEPEYMTAVAAFQQTIVDDPPAIFLAWIQRARAVAKRFIVPPVEQGRDVLSNLRLWKPASDGPRMNHD